MHLRVEILKKGSRLKVKLANNRVKQITIIGDADASLEAYQLAEKIGTEIAKLGYAVVTGGRGGIMEAANKGAFEAGGISIGILPSAARTDANSFCNIVIPTGIGHARNTITALSCDAIVSLGGGAGTLSEICFGWIYKKPIFVFPQFDGWSEKVADQPLDRKYLSKIEACSSVEEMSKKIRRLFGD